MTFGFLTSDEEPFWLTLNISEQADVEEILRCATQVHLEECISEPKYPDEKSGRAAGAAGFDGDLLG
jgi:hypothetical protein